MDVSVFDKIIDLIFWGILAGGFFYGPIFGGMALSKAIKVKNSADQEDATYQLGAGGIICIIGIGGASFFPSIPTF